MDWLFQSPGGGPTLLEAISKASVGALRGGGAFAFASRNGVKLFGDDARLKDFLGKRPFSLLVGLDAITDTKALEELANLSSRFPKLDVQLFLHKKASLFHPKTLWFEHTSGGVIVTGSGNMTPGGLESNWEVTCVGAVPKGAIARLVGQWDDWLDAHKEEIVALDNAEAVAKAKRNSTFKSGVKKVLKLGGHSKTADEAVEVISQVVSEASAELSSRSFLVAEIPKNGDRWHQFNFDIKSYTGFFGVVLGKTKIVKFRRVKKDGSLYPVEAKPPVPVKSQNYRFEFGSAHGVAYPAAGTPIGLFEKIGEHSFKYILLMPGDPGHLQIKSFLDMKFKPSKKMRRVTIGEEDLETAWPTSPLLK